MLSRIESSGLIADPEMHFQCYCLLEGGGGGGGAAAPAPWQESGLSFYERAHKSACKAPRLQKWAHCQKKGPHTKQGENTVTVAISKKSNNSLHCEKYAMPFSLHTDEDCFGRPINQLSHFVQRPVPKLANQKVKEDGQANHVQASPQCQTLKTVAQGTTPVRVSAVFETPF